MSTTSGQCSQVSNSTDANQFTLDINCTGTGLTAHTVTITTNDSYSNTTVHTFDNTYPNDKPIAIIIEPTGDQNINFTVNLSKDDDDPDITWTWSVYINGTLNTTTTTNFTMNWSTGSYLMNVSVSDGIEESDNVSSTFNVVVADTTDPTATTLNTNGTGLTLYGETVNWTVTITDETQLQNYSFAHNRS